MPTKSLSNREAGDQRTAFENMLQESVVCGVLACDSEGKVLALTPEAERVFHRHSSSEPHPQNLPEPIRAVVREVQTTGRMVAGRRVVLAAPGAEPAPIILTAVSVACPNEPCIILIAKELRPGMPVEQNLERLDRLASVGLVAASMTHEIKNALVAIKTFVDLLLEKNQDPDLAEVVRREVGRVDSLVTRMLGFAGSAQPALAAVHLHDLLDHSLRLVQHRVEHKLITFQRNFRAAPDVLTGDDRQLEQAFVNILFNAIEAMGRDGTLTVTTDLAPGDRPTQPREGAASSALLRIEISDTGVGIPPDSVGRIFEPFFTTKPNGTGLGLAVTRRIIHEHQGAIHVESSPGKGTTFVILLPAG